MLKFICFTFLTLLNLDSRAESSSHQSLDEVSLSSTKKGSTRFYSANKNKVLSYGIHFVKLATTDFANRCNNEFKNKRRFTPKSLTCRHHNDHLIESFVDKVLPPKPQVYSEAFLLARQIYNRGQLGYYELVTIQESRDEKNKQKIIINLKMLNDSEVKEFSSPKFSQDSAFDQSQGTFVLTELSPESTNLSYSYLSETDHWLLNKEVSVTRVFSSIARSINDLFEAIEDEALLRKKEEEAKEAAEK
jgi:hypothetical protein